MDHQTLRKGPVILNMRGSLLRHRGQPAGAVLLEWRWSGPPARRKSWWRWARSRPGWPTS
jgi:hypothetical protein